MSVKHSSYPVGQFVLAYLLAWVALLVSAAAEPAFGLIMYPVCGLALNRFILSRIVWHKVYDTVGQVARAKLGAFLLWPVAYPRFFFLLMAAKYL